MTFGEKLLKLRKENGLSQEKLATQLAVSRQAVSRWEMGTSLPDVENIIQLSKLFGVSADYLIRDDYTAPEEVRADSGNAVPPGKAHRHLALLISGILCSGLGVLGNLVIWLCSTMTLVYIPAPPVPAGTDTTYVSETWVRAYAPFIEHYHLEAMVDVLWLLFFIGLACFVAWMRGKRRAVKTPPAA